MRLAVDVTQFSSSELSPPAEGLADRLYGACPKREWRFRDSHIHFNVEKLYTVFDGNNAQDHGPVRLGKEKGAWIKTGTNAMFPDSDECTLKYLA